MPPREHDRACSHSSVRHAASRSLLVPVPGGALHCDLQVLAWATEWRQLERRHDPLDNPSKVIEQALAKGQRANLRSSTFEARADYGRVSSIEMPCPTPMHMVAIARLAHRASSSNAAVGASQTYQGDGRARWRLRWD